MAIQSQYYLSQVIGSNLGFFCRKVSNYFIKSRGRAKGLGNIDIVIIKSKEMSPFCSKIPTFFQMIPVFYQMFSSNEQR